jgi:hypothetical protein
VITAPSDCLVSLKLSSPLRTLRSEGLLNFYFLRDTKLILHIPRMHAGDQICTRNFRKEKCAEKRSLAKHEAMHTQGDNIKVNVKETGCNRAD